MQSRDIVAYLVIAVQTSLLGWFASHPHIAPISFSPSVGPLRSTATSSDLKDQQQLRANRARSTPAAFAEGGVCHNPTAHTVERRLWCPDSNRNNCSMDDFNSCVRLMQTVHPVGDHSARIRALSDGSDIEEHRRRWADEGWAVLRGAVSDQDLLKAVRSYVNATLHRGDRITNGYQTLVPIRALGEFPGIVEYIEDISGRRPNPFQTLNFKTGTQQPVHSDLMHFATFPQGLMVAAWVALEDVHDDAGPLVVYPGSHKTPVVYYDELGISSNRNFRRSSPQAAYKQYEVELQKQVLAKLPAPVRITMKAGDAFIWAANLYHGGSAVTNPQSTRMSQVTHYFLDGANSFWVPKMSSIPAGDINIREGPEVWMRKRVV